MQTNTLHKRNEITLEDKNLIRPKFAQSYFVEDSIEATKHIKAIRPVLNYSMKGTNSLASMPPHCLLMSG